MKRLAPSPHDSAHRSLGQLELLRHWGVLCRDLMDCCLGPVHLNRKPADQQHLLIAYILCVHINPSACLLPQLFSTGSLSTNGELHSLLGNWRLYLDVIFADKCQSLFSAFPVSAV